MANYGIAYERQNQESRTEAENKLKEIQNRCKSMVCITEVIHEFGRITVREKWIPKENSDENT